jgi:hypothetical protein
MNLSPYLSLLGPPTLDSIDKAVTMVLESLIPTFASVDNVKTALANRWLNKAIKINVTVQYNTPKSAECPCGIKEEQGHGSEKGGVVGCVVQGKWNGARSAGARRLSTPLAVVVAGLALTYGVAFRPRRLAATSSMLPWFDARGHRNVQPSRALGETLVRQTHVPNAPSGAADSPRFSRLFSCAGTESNRRHGDFQSPRIVLVRAEKPWIRGVV